MDHRLLFPLALALLPACGSRAPAEPPRAPSVPVADAPAEVAAKPKRAVPAGHLRREDVVEIVSAGPPAFLAKLDVRPARDPSTGRFAGWEIVQISDPELAAGAVRPGDVVTRVNGKKIEDPFQFFDVFRSLVLAPELRISVVRGKETQELRFPIDEEPGAADAPRPRASAAP
ncbi:MAG: hypothetical protein IT374_12225 [Polyangiaceae bacterium]|nr:hypothetical protein [Polyangiaceae bacterium]